eukprot:gene6961-11123_t
MDTKQKGDGRVIYKEDRSYLQLLWLQWEIRTVTYMCEPWEKIIIRMNF